MLNTYGPGSGYNTPTTIHPPSSWNTLVNAVTGQEIPLAMQHLSLTGHVSPAGALLRATHLFRCAPDMGSPLEAIYVFMLPRNTTLRRFIVKGDGFEVESKVTPREEARKEYEAGVQDGHLSTLAEVEMDGMVSLLVGQVQPDETITVIVEVFSGVEVSDGHYRFRFPFTLAPNYHAQAKMIPTATGGKIELPNSVFGDLVLPEWKADTSGLHQVSFKIHVDAGGSMDSVASPSHRIRVRPQSDGSAEVELSSLGDTPNRDLVLDVIAKDIAPVVFADQKIVSRVADPDDPKTPDKAPRWTAVIPSSVLPKAANAPREVCFVLDRSGSMSGEPLERAKVALRACLSAMMPTDKFGIIHFGPDAVVFDKHMVPATDANRKRAQRWIDEIEANGGTELPSALGEAVDVLGAPGKDIYLLTDGQVGETGPIIEQCAASGTRIHVMGIGSASQDRFLASLSRRTGGVQKMIGIFEDVASSGLEMFNAIRQPVQADVKATVNLDAGGSQTHDIGTVWDGRSIVVTDNGESGDQMPVTVEFTWNGGSCKVDLPIKRATPNGLSALLWAGRQVEDLESQLDITKAGPAFKIIEAELKDISAAYGLASRVMSLVAVTHRPGDQVKEVIQQVVPVGTPEGMAMFGGGLTRGTYCSLGSFYSTGSTTFNMSASNNMTYTVHNAASDTGFLIKDRDDDYVDTLDSSNLSWKSVKHKSAVRCFANAPVPKASAVFDLILEAGDIEADGGLPGKTNVERFFKTAFLALAMLKADGERSGAPLFTAHLKRIATFLESFVQEFSNTPKAADTIKVLVKALRDRKPINGDWQKEYLGYKGDDKAAWNVLTAAR